MFCFFENIVKLAKYRPADEMTLTEFTDEIMDNILVCVISTYKVSVSFAKKRGNKQPKRRPIMKIEDLNGKLAYAVTHSYKDENRYAQQSKTNQKKKKCLFCCVEF